MHRQHSAIANGVLNLPTVSSTHPICAATGAAALLVVLLGVTGCASLGVGLAPPDVQIANLVALESTAFEQRMQVDLRVRNPNRAPLEVEGIRFAIDLNGRPLGSGQSGELFAVPGLGDAVVSLVMTTTLLDLVQQLFALQERSDFGYEIYGDVFLAGHWRPIPFSRVGQLSRAQDPLSEGG